MIDWKNLRRVVVPIDLSEPSFEALRAARELAPAGRITVFHALPHLSAVEPGVVYGEIDDDTRVRNAEKRVREALQRGQLPDELEVEARVGAPGVTICDFAEESSADLVVVASHGRTGMSRLLLGSVAEVVVRHAPCPVLVARHTGEASSA